MRKAKNKKLFLFSLAVLSSASLLVVTWLAGLLVGAKLPLFWAGFGGMFGAIIGAEIGLRKRGINAKWDRTLAMGPMAGYLLTGGIALHDQLPDLLVTLSAVLGGGVGVLLSKYLMEFFNYEKPPSIL